MFLYFVVIILTKGRFDSRQKEVYIYGIFRKNKLDLLSVIQNFELALLNLNKLLFFGDNIVFFHYKLFYKPESEAVQYPFFRQRIKHINV